MSYEADLEQMQQEDAIWPWLADDSMADPCNEDCCDDNDIEYGVEEGEEELEEA